MLLAAGPSPLASTSRLHQPDPVELSVARPCKHLPPAPRAAPARLDEPTAVAAPAHVAALPTELSGGRLKKFLCPHAECGKAYTRPTRLAEHVRSHTGEKPFACSECSSTFGRDSHLKAHMRTHATEEDKKYGCSECDKKFWTNQHLKKHREIYHLGKTYDCTVCDESFRKHNLLKAHVLEDHCEPGTDPFPCEHLGCDKSFKQKVHHKAHAKTHDTSRYTCSHESCDNLALELRTFATWSALQKHHKAEHPPQCPHPECDGKTFTTPRGLKNHLIVHEEQEGGVEKGKKRMRGRGNKKSKRRVDESATEEDAEETEMEMDASENEARPKKLRLEAPASWKCEFVGCTKTFKSGSAKSEHFDRVHQAKKTARIPRSASPAKARRVASRSASPPVTDEAVAAADAMALLYRLTGFGYGPSTHPSAPIPERKFACPFPGISAVAQQIAAAPAGSVVTGDKVVDQQTSCEFRFKRIYDVERHLRATHGLVVDRNTLADWMEGEDEEDDEE